MLLKYLANLKVNALAGPLMLKGCYNTYFAPSSLHNLITSRMLCHLVAPCLTLSAPHAIKKKSKKNRSQFGQVKFSTIYKFGENNESGIWSRQVPVWRGLISIVLSVINSGPNNYYGIDRIPVCTGSGMYKLHCTCIWSYTSH